MTRGNEYKVGKGDDELARSIERSRLADGLAGYQSGVFNVARDADVYVKLCIDKLRARVDHALASPPSSVKTDNLVAARLAAQDTAKTFRLAHDAAVKMYRECDEALPGSYRFNNADHLRVDEPKGVTQPRETTTERRTTDHALKLQVERMVNTFEDPIERDHWLAGVRFVLGYIEHGSKLQDMSDDQLRMELAEEHADAVNYSIETERRHRDRAKSTGYAVISSHGVKTTKNLR